MDVVLGIEVATAHRARLRLVVSMFPVFLSMLFEGTKFSRRFKERSNSIRACSIKYLTS